MNVIYLFFNPLLIFSVSLLIALLSTYLEWSTLFDTISEETRWIYFSVSLSGILLSLTLHPKIGKTLSRNSRVLLSSFSYSSNDKYLCFVLITFFIIEILYSGYIPIFAGDYEEILNRSFGIPVIHGLYMSFISYISILYFQKHLSCKLHKKKNTYIVYILFLNFIFILMGRRGIIVFNCLSYTFLYIFYYISMQYNLKKLALLLVAITTIFLYGFNLLGNLRLGTNSNDFILNIGKASDDFKESIIPKEFFYAYLYISTPVQIFDINRKNHELPLSNFIVVNIIPDFISKRINIPLKEVESHTIVNGFNVGGLFLKPYRFLGELGIALLFVYYLFFFILVFFSLLHNKKRALLALAILSSISVLLTFSNLLNASGYILQLYYALLFVSFNRFKINGIPLLPIKRKQV